jgi:transketolase
MGDGEQQKGQIVEAQRFATKYGLSNLTVIVDRNYLQISGDTRRVMPMDIPAQYKASGWKVLEVADGNDLEAMYVALRKARRYTKAPTCIVARTVMSKGVPFMEDKEEWHGKALPEDDCRKALAILGLPDDVDKYKAMRASLKAGAHPESYLPPVTISAGTPRTYPVDKKSDCRGAWGAAIADLAEANRSGGSSPIVVFDCDLASSVRTEGFAKILPDNFIQAGITEHNACAMAGAMSTQGILSFWADFAVFGTDETYNQHRLNDINGSSVKVVITHAGTDVGEDGKTHQCIDYVGTFRNIFNYHVIVPADPNETDRAVRYAATHEGNFVIAMGRSKMSMITAADGSLAFAGDYQFKYGTATFVREGKDVTIIAMGPMVGRALIVRDLLAKRGIDAGVLNMSSPTAPDSQALRKAAASTVVAVYEDHNVRTGLAAVVSEFCAQEGLNPCFLRFGIARYASSGTPEELLKIQNIDPESVAEMIASALKTAR